MRSRPRAFLVVCAVMFLAINTAFALDFNDIVTLRQNNVPDSVIISMLQQQGGMTLTPGQHARLRESGASGNLLSAFTVAQPAAAPLQSAPSAGRVAGEGDPVTPLRVAELDEMPLLYSGEGWLSISNTDREPYFLVYDTKSRNMLLSEQPNGGIEIPAGTNIAVNIRKGTYKLYGDSGRELKVHVREHEATYLSLAPFGVVGNSGLTGVSRDRERSRSETLFSPWAPPVVVQPAPVVVIPAPPPPVYYYDYGYEHYYPRRHGFSFDYRW